jgi:hypothetical protein
MIGSVVLHCISHTFYHHGKERIRAENRLEKLRLRKIFLNLPLILVRDAIFKELDDFSRF